MCVSIGPGPNGTSSKPRDSGPTPMYIDSPPPTSTRTTLPPLESQFDPAVRRGSITDPVMHATSSTDPYRTSNGAGPRASLHSFANSSSRPHSIRDERPPTPDFSERRSIDSDSLHEGYHRHHSFASDHQSTHPSLSRKSSASGWSRVNGNAETASLKGFDQRLSHLHLDSTTSLASTSTQASNRPATTSSAHSRAQQYISDYHDPPHRRITPHLAPPISTTAPGTFAERYPQSKTYPYPHPNAPHPTPGYPYAFPDPQFEAAREPSTSTSSASPQGIHYQRSLPSLHPVHEQSIRDSDMSGLMAGGSQAPYSRSPELRVSHKLAERKRRREMKDLFDELRDSLPVDKTLKTSKWEILSKGTLSSFPLLGQRTNVDS